MLIKSFLITVFSFATIIASFSPVFMISMAKAETIHQNIGISVAWARASAIKTARAGAAYLTLTNHGKQTDKLTGAHSKIANRTEIHTHTAENGIMRMAPAGIIPISAGDVITFAPGGLHIMLIGLKEPLKEGATTDITLMFEKAGAIPITVDILSVAAKGPDANSHTQNPHLEHGQKTHKHQHKH